MRLFFKIMLAVIAALVLLIAGCTALLAVGVEEATKDKDGVVLVEAPSGRCWSGAIGDATRDGCGTKRFRLREVIFSANAQKRTAGRWPLRITLIVEGERKDTARTTARFGVVSVAGS